MYRARRASAPDSNLNAAREGGPAGGCGERPPPQSPISRVVIAGRGSVIEHPRACLVPHLARGCAGGTPGRCFVAEAAATGPGIEGCLLYTSDAADEEDSVDVGGS